MTDKNLELWNSVKNTDKKFTKEVSLGRKFTAIDPYYQIRIATEQWGSYGSTWGFKEISLGFELSHLDLVTFKGIFYYPNGEFPIINSVFIKTTQNKEKSKLDPDFAKKVETDTLTKALSKLGFSADIFLGKFDDDITPNVPNKSISDNQDLFTLINDFKTLENATKFLKIHATQLNADIELKKAFLAKKKGL